MCILFVRLGEAKDGEFKLILASNRDEFFGRPAKEAQFWNGDGGGIVGGRDMTEKKEGGTWLAMSKGGKVGVILNVSGAKADPQKLGRGFLIADYLTGTSTSVEHLTALSATGQRFNGFHLVAIESGESKPILSHYSNGDSSGRVTSVSDGVFAIGNNPLDKPHLKVKRGKARFEEVIGRWNRTDAKEELVQQLLDLLKWEEKHVDEEAMALLPQYPKEFLRGTSSVFINIPSAGYGTRTHTIILVDRNGKVDFYEWTLKEPINPDKKDWVSTHIRFDIIRQ